MIRDKIIEQYRDWLIDQVNVVDGLDYGPMLRQLFFIEFYWTVPHDEDRAMDGAALRGDFEDIYNLPVNDLGPARFLEVLIGIAKRVEFQLFGRTYLDEQDYVKIFWDFIWNLGLQDTYGTLSEEDYDKIDYFVTLFLNHEKSVTQNCHIFGFDYGQKSVKKMNLWDQMMVYVREKWPR